MNAKFKIKHTISSEELQVYNAIISKLNYGFDGLISLEEIKQSVNCSSSQIICLLTELRQRVIIIHDYNKQMEVSTTLLKFDFIFINKTEVYMNFENVEIFDVEFTHYLGKFRSNQAYRSYENLDGRFSYYEDKIEVERKTNKVFDDWALNIIEKVQASYEQVN